jgi:hypothetical protein
MYSITTMLAAAHGVDRALATLKRDGHLGGFSDSLMSIDRYNELVGLPAKESLELRYAEPE